MLEAYSTDIDVAEGAAIPFNNVTIRKGCTATLSAPATIQLNKAGVYMIHVDGSIAPTAVGDVSIQLSKNGVVQPQAQSIETGAAGDSSSLCFETLVQVPQNNTPCCCSSPTTIQIINTGEAGNYSIAHIVVTKVC